MKLARLLRISGISIGVMAVMAVVGVFVWFWRSQQPCDEARKLEAVYRDRPVPATNTNAFFDVYGFGAPANVDANSHGAARVAWLQKWHADADSAGLDPAREDFDREDLNTAQSARIADACRDGSAKLCAELVAAVADDAPLNSQETLMRQRYEALLTRLHWFEPLPFLPEDTLPRYADVLDAQRTAFIRLRQAARHGDSSGLRDFLERDLRFWRMAGQHSDTLISKMISVAGVRAHFAYANLVLRELPAASVAEFVPPIWHQPLSDAERSLWRVMAGEYMFSKNAIADMYGDGDEYSLDESMDNPIRRVFGKVRRQIEPPRKLNELARLYAATAEAFAVPLNRHQEAHKELSEKYLDALSTMDAGMYALRAGSIEGMRRAALLTVQLRSRSVPVESVEAELRKSELRTPVMEQPFVWNAAEQAIVFPGPMKKRRSGLALYY